ncbi:MAG: YHS domain-containing (seleno)protein [Ginsengibacter sp.]
MKTIQKSFHINEMLKETLNKNRFFKIVFVGMLILMAVFTTINVKAQKYHGKYLNNVDAKGVIIDGYDPVAFFTDNKPLKGDPKFQYNYEEATYYFANQEHLDLFKADPEKYKPQFGAWCAYAVSLGRTAPINVNTFSIVNGKLVIQHNQKAVRGWNEDVKGNLKLADKYWPAVTANGGKQIKTAADKGILVWIIASVVTILFLSWMGIRNNKKMIKRRAMQRRAQSRSSVNYSSYSRRAASKI